MKTKQKISILLLLICFYQNGFSQSYYDSQKQNREYKSLQGSTARAYAVPVRQSSNNSSYRSSSSYSSGSNSSNSSSSGHSTSNRTISTNNDNYSWGMTGRYEREKRERIAYEAKQDKIKNAYQEKVAIIESCYKKFGKTKENYEQIYNCALNSGVDDYTTSRLMGFSADDFQSMIDRENEKKYANNYQYNNNSSTDPNINGNFTGYGRKKYDKGTYVGNLVTGVINGQGKFTYLAGDSYEGNFIDNVRVGKGIYKYTDGASYSGDYVNDEQTGKGKLSWTNGDVYEGDFVKGIRTGKGIFNWANGDKYEGDFVQYALFGKGKLLWKDGSTYEGDFINGNRTGKGIFIWRNGDKYEGDFNNDQLQGKGKFSRKNGNYYSGHFENGILNSAKYYNKKNQQISKAQFDADL